MSSVLARQSGEGKRDPHSLYKPGTSFVRGTGQQPDVRQGINLNDRYLSTGVESQVSNPQWSSVRNLAGFIILFGWDLARSCRGAETGDLPDSNLLLVSVFRLD